MTARHGRQRKVYLLTRGEYSGRYVVGIYATPDAAQAAVRLAAEEARAELRTLMAAPPAETPPRTIAWWEQRSRETDEQLAEADISVWTLDGEEVRG
jgi:hypothetical protein